MDFVDDALTLAIGLLVANVPEGLLRRRRRRSVGVRGCAVAFVKRLTLSTLPAHRRDLFGQDRH